MVELTRPIEVLVANAFALSMLDPEVQRYGHYCGARTPTPCDDGSHKAAKEFLNKWERTGEAVVRSIVGHADTARVFSAMLERDIAPNRESVKLKPHQILLVGQYVGPRLPEGATELPEGASIFWWTI